MTTSPYLTGHFAPVAEEVTAYDLPVTGSLPAHLSGRYLRNGPNLMGLEDLAVPYSWTLGEGMVHGVRIRDGRAEWYRNRWVRSGPVADRLGEPRRGAPVNELMDIAPSVHVVGLGGRTFALLEGGIRPYELDYELGTVGPSDLGATPEGYSANAHSAFDAAAGELHSLAFQYGREEIQHIVMDPAGGVLRTHTVAMPGNPYMHDFALTDAHVVLFDSPIVFSPAHLPTGIPFGWDHDRPSRVGLMPRTGGEPVWFELGYGFVGHAVNAHDTPRGVVVDVIVHPEEYDLRELGASRPVLERWTVDTVTGRVRQDRLDDRPQDFPRVNARHARTPNRYAYSAVTELYTMPLTPDGDRPDAGLGSSLLKHDLHAGRTEAHDFGRDHAVGEAVFVPAEASAAEDDGYLMTYVFDPERGATDLVVLSASDFTGPPVARVHLPVRVPLGLHGSWIADV